MRQRTRATLTAALLLIVTLFVLLATLIYWASGAELDEATSGQGQVIPSSQIKVVQNLEGGIVSEIMVKQNEAVELGQVLMRIDDTSASANFAELREAHFGLLASVTRLEAEVNGEVLVFSEEIQKERPDLIGLELQLFETRKRELESSIAVLDQQLSQRRTDLRELETRLRGLRRMRPGFPRLRSLTLIPWLRYIDSLVTTGVWERVIDRLCKAAPGDDELLSTCETALKELKDLEKAELLAVVRGDNYRTIWSAR